MRRIALLWLVLAVAPAAAAISGCSGPVAEPQSTPAPASATQPAAQTKLHAPSTFAVIGDYGTDDVHERPVVDLVATWNPAFVLATGDDDYRRAGGSGTGRYDESNGAYYGRWLRDSRAACSSA